CASPSRSPRHGAHRRPSDAAMSRVSSPGWMGRVAPTPCLTPPSSAA
ncbi:MAG: hypothetical protein AVDCRST_MAG70-470, partial [uncultured Thermomicrobiales bacterium]